MILQKIRYTASFSIATFYLKMLLFHRVLVVCQDYIRIKVKSGFFFLPGEYFLHDSAVVNIGVKNRFLVSPVEFLILYQ